MGRVTPSLGPTIRVLVLDGLAAARLPGKRVKQLLVAAGDLPALQVVSLRGCGLEKLDGLRWPQLLRAYLDDNRIASPRTVWEFVVASPGLECLSLLGNPVATVADWPATAGRAMARLPFLGELNRAAVGLQDLLVAAQRFGSVEDRRRLASRVFADVLARTGAEVCARAIVCVFVCVCAFVCVLVGVGAWCVWQYLDFCPAVRSSRKRLLAHPPPASPPVPDRGFFLLCCQMSLERIEDARALVLAGSLLQAVAFSPLSELRSLDLSNNLLTSLLDSGLSACGSLEALRVANNRLADPEHAKYFALLPALKVLDVRGNPFAAAPRTRCAGAGAGVGAWLLWMRLCLAIPLRVRAPRRHPARVVTPTPVSTPPPLIPRAPAWPEWPAWHALRVPGCISCTTRVEGAAWRGSRGWASWTVCPSPFRSAWLRLRSAAARSRRWRAR